jgi:hypothetical protein
MPWFATTDITSRVEAKGSGSSASEVSRAGRSDSVAPMMFAQTWVTGVGVATTLVLLVLGYRLSRPLGVGAAARATLMKSPLRFAALALLVIAIFTFVLTFQSTVCVVDDSHGQAEYRVFKLLGSASVHGKNSTFDITLPPNARSAIVNDSATKLALRRVFYAAGGRTAKPPYVFKIVEPGMVAYVNDAVVDHGGAPMSIESHIPSESRLELVPATTEDLRSK